MGPFTQRLMTATLALAIGLAYGCAAGEDDTESADGHLTGDEASSKFPAFPELKLPLVQNHGGPIMKSVRIVPVLINGLDRSEGDDIVKALAAWTKSSAWSTQLSEYGVGAGSVAPTIYYDEEVPSTEPGKFSLADQQAFVKAHAEEWDPPSDDSYYVVLFPPDGLKVLDGRGTPECEVGGGGHPTVALDDGTVLKFSALQRCPFEQVDASVTHADIVNRMTFFVSHEVVESASNPVGETQGGAFVDVDPADVAWQIQYGGEIGDMCDQIAVDTPKFDMFSPPEMGGVAIQRSWSNSEAKQLHDPCVPHVPDPYFNAGFVLPDTIKQGSTEARVIKVPLGESRTIDVKLFSTAATDGRWKVEAVQNFVLAPNDTGKLAEVDGIEPLELTLDRSEGQNGDILKLTIHASPEKPAALTLFQTISTLGDRKAFWDGAVSTLP